MIASLIAVISDTHLPKGNRKLPVSCISRLRAADLIIHAGDLSSVALLDEIREYGDVAAVHGNVDSADVRALLPNRLELTLGTVRLAVIHDAGPSAGRLRRLQSAFPDAGAVIFGHSHIPLLECNEDSRFQIFNPGSPTDRRRQPNNTMGMARISDGAISFEIVAL